MNLTSETQIAMTTEDGDVRIDEAGTGRLIARVGKGGSIVGPLVIYDTAGNDVLSVMDGVTYKPVVNTN